MSLSLSIASRTDRLEYLRRVANMPIAPSPNGAINRDSVVYLVKFALGQTDRIFLVSGAIRCSGATDAQIAAFIEMLAQLPPGISDIEAIVCRVAEELRIPVASLHTFPAVAPDPLTTSAPDIDAARSNQCSQPSGHFAPRQEDEGVPNAQSHPVTTEEENPRQKNGPISLFLMVVVSFFVIALFLSFFILWAREGWSAANQKNPVGSALVFIALCFIYLLAIPLLRDQGHRTLPNIMLWIAIAVGGVFVSSMFPSCSDESSQFPLDRPYRK